MELRNIDLKILAGYQQLKSPEIVINEEIKWWMGGVGSGINTMRSFQKGLIAENLALNVGADLKVHVYKKVELMLSFNYILSSPQYKSQIVYTYDKYDPIRRIQRLMLLLSFIKVFRFSV
jgi:hypothetical protein